VIYEENRVLIDRQTLAKLTGRSVHTIRAKCPVAGHRQGKAVYDMDECDDILNAVPTRRPRKVSSAA
jgi:hypothetical protein